MRCKKTRPGMPDSMTRRSHGEWRDEAEQRSPCKSGDLRSQECGGQGKVLGKGNFEVERGALRDGDGKADTFVDLGIIRQVVGAIVAD